MADVVGWRIVKEKHAATAFSGEGAKRFPGRWNSAGTPMVYCSESLALAALEILVHTQPAFIRDPFRAFRVTWPESVMTAMDYKRLPTGWNMQPAGAASQTAGDEWIWAARSAVLAAPSSVIPPERTYLLNPQHRDFRTIKIADTGRFSLDPRLR